MATEQRASENDRPLPRLARISEKILPTKCKPDTVAYCPTMDLIALATADEQVNVYRLNGQRVFGGNYKAANAWGDDDDEGQKREVRGLSWKSDGNSLAVVCSDNVIRILSAATGKTVHLLRCGPSQEESSSAQETASPIPMCIGWQTNFVDRKRSLKTLEEAEGLTLESLLSPEGKVTKLERLKADLPRMLKLLDPADALPKLSTLPATNDDQDVFSTRSSVDAIFHAKKDTGETVDVLVVAFNDASVHFRIFASFEIGTIDLRNSLGTTSQVNPIRHASHPLTCTHSLLYHVPAEDRLSLVTLDLEFIPRSKTYVYVLASQTTQLQNLLRYIKQTQTQIQLEWKNAQDLPSRWLRSVNIDLKEKQDCDFIAAVFHCVCTGVCWEPLREFLVDIVADRGHKRWDKAVNTGYDSIRKLCIECFLPALERATALLTRLRGLSMFWKTAPILGLDQAEVDACQETIDCLQLMGHKIIKYSTDELNGFQAFSKWLKHEIDFQTAEPGSQTREDIDKKADELDQIAILKYTAGALTNSALEGYILPAGQKPKSTEKWMDPAEKKGEFGNKYKELLSAHDKEIGERWPVVRIEKPSTELPLMNDLTARLDSQFEVMFTRIARTQREGICHRCPLTLPSDCSPEVIDMTMNLEPSDEDAIPSVYIAAASKTSPNTIRLYRVELVENDGVTTTKAIFQASLSLHGGTATAIKFLEDGTMTLLWKDDSQDRLTHLVQLPYLTGDSSFKIDYREFSRAKSKSSHMPMTALELGAEGQHANCIRHTFTAEESRESMSIEVQGRPKGRRVVCVLSSQGKRYRVLDLDAIERKCNASKVRVKDQEGDRIMGDAY